MPTVNSHQANICPARPVEQAAKRLGFLSEPLSVPEDFDRMDRCKIERLFSGVP